MVNPQSGNPGGNETTTTTTTTTAAATAATPRNGIKLESKSKRRGQ